MNNLTFGDKPPALLRDDSSGRGSQVRARARGPEFRRLRPVQTHMDQLATPTRHRKILRVDEVSVLSWACGSRCVEIWRNQGLKRGGDTGKPCGRPGVPGTMRGRAAGQSTGRVAHMLGLQGADSAESSSGTGFDPRATGRIRAPGRNRALFDVRQPGGQNIY